MKDRLAYVDAAKGLSILMIALGHITKLGNPVDCWMSSFKVAIFYIISGFLMAYTGSVKSRNFSQFSRRILKTLALPYLSFSIIGILFKAGCVYLKHKPSSDVWDVFLRYFYDSVFLKGVNSMWFIPTLFVGEIIFFLLIRSHIAIKVIYGIAGVFAIKFSYICIGFIESIGIFSTGSDAYDNVVKIVNALCKGISAAWFIGVGYFVYYFYKKLTNNNIKLVIGSFLSIINLILSQINKGVDFNQMKEGDYPAMFYICGVIGSLGAILILDFITSYVRLGFLDYWGRNSLIVMCTHTVLGMRTVAYEGWKKVAYIPKTAGLEYICECLVVLAILLLIEYSIVEIVNSRFYFLIGKEKVHE